jgi:N-acetylneuraminic acid mutarotase
MTLLAALLLALGLSACGGNPSWVRRAAMPEALAELTGAVGGDGRIYAIARGYVGDNGTLHDPLEVYDPATDTWAALRDQPLTNDNAGAGVATGDDGRIYELGGVGNGSSMMVYDPPSRTWICGPQYDWQGCDEVREVAPMPTPRSDMAVVNLGGRIYAFGGVCDAGPDCNGKVEEVVEAYDPATNTWACSVGDYAAGCATSTLSPMPVDLTQNTQLAVVANGGRVYLLGGETDLGYFVDWVLAYDPAKNLWQCSADAPASSGCADKTLAPLPHIRMGAAAARGFDGRIYYIGGNADGATSGTIDAYNPASNVWWGAVPALNDARAFFAAVTAPDGSIYVFGGYGSSTDKLASAERYSAASGAGPTGVVLPASPRDG